MNGLRRNWLVRGLSSSVGQKLVMGITGLALCGFLVVHLAGNLLMYGGPESYNGYARALHANELLPLAEAGLFGLFVFHIWLAFTVTRLHTQARPVEYAVRESKQPSQVFRPESFMFYSGLIILAFLILHIWDMKIGREGLTATFKEEPDPFLHTLRVLHDPVSAGVYAFASLFVGAHVWHGLRSALQTVGFSHPRYNTFIEVMSVLFGIVIGLGFAALPFWFHVFYGTP